METNVSQQENLHQAPCPKCGERVASNFKFCPFCGQEMARVEKLDKKLTAEAEFAPVADVPIELVNQDEKNVSPEARRALEEFDRKFEELKRIREAKPAKSMLSVQADNKIMIAILAAAMIIFLLFMGHSLMNMAKIAQK